MESSNKTTINFIIWAETNEEGHSAAKSITGVDQTNEGLYSTEENSVIVNAYLRGPKCTTHASPNNGVTDILLLLVSTDEGLVGASEYVSLRKGISQKYVISANDQKDFAEKNGCVYADSLEKSLIQRVKKCAIDSDHALRKAFAILDIDHNGYITSDELITVSKDLGHELNIEEAKEIAHTISEDSKISYDKFKHWWFAGRTDFVQFRSLVQMEFKMRSMMKKGSHVFKEFKNNQLNDTLIGRINIKPKVDFENGISFKLNYAIGDQGKDIISSLPDYFSTNVMTYSIEIQIDNAENGTMLVNQLEGIKEMIFQLVPQASQMVSMGLNVKFRHVGTSVFVDITLGGMIGDMISAQLGQYNNGSLNFSAFGSGFVISGIKLNAPLDTSYDDFVKMATQFKVETHGEVLGLKSMWELLSQFIIATKPNDKFIKMGLNIFKIYTSFKKIEYNSEYDSDEMCRLVKELAGRIGHQTLGGASMEELNPEIGTQIIGGMVAGFQEKGKSQLEGIKMMISQVLAPFTEAISAINLDNIGISVTLPILNLNYKLNICFIGLTEFIRTSLLN